MRTIRRFGAVALTMAGALALAACGGGEDNVTPSSAPELVAEGPLGARNDALVAAVGDEVIVFGGNNFICPPTADCNAPDKPPFSDGAAYNVASGEWRSIANGPFGIDNTAAISRGGIVYAISQCEKAPSCPAGRRMLSYDVGEDSWGQFAGVPGGNGFHHLVFIDEALFAISISDETGQPDYLYDAPADAWTEVARPPLPALYDRFGIEWDGKLLLYGSPIDGELSANKLVASYGPASGEWITLDAATSQGYQPYALGDIVVLNGHFGNAAGAVHDLTKGTWSDLPSPPESSSWTGDIAGVIGHGHAEYESSHGWFLDIRTDSWIRLESQSQRALSNESVVAVGNKLFVFGGHYFTDDDVKVEGGATLWTPPEPPG